MNNSLSILIIGLIGLALIFASCENLSGPDQTFGESVERIPHLTEIPGADNVSITVNRNQNSSYFMIDLDNIADNGIIGNGVYEAWCALWNAPINSNGDQYHGVQLWSTKDDPKWNSLNYLINNAYRYYYKYDELTWREVQLAIWDLLDYQNFDLENNNAFYSGDVPQYDINLVNTLIEDVIIASEGYTHQSGNYFAVFADMSGHETSGSNTQNLLIVVLDPDDADGIFGATYKNGNTLLVKIPNSMSGAMSTPQANRSVSFIYTPGQPHTSQHSVLAQYNTINSNMTSSCSVINNALPKVEDLKTVVVIINPDPDVDMTFTGITVNGIDYSELEATNGEKQAWALGEINIQSGFEITGELNFNGPFLGTMQILLAD